MRTTATERRPTSRDWRESPVPAAIPRDEYYVSGSRWQRGTVVVISTLVLCDLPRSNGLVGPTWHASISRLGKRPRPRDVEHFKRDFGLVGAEEDNHHPGAARHYFMPIDPAYRVGCECKIDEDIITEPGGYQWTNPKVGECRGCEFERLRGWPCPLHGKAAHP